MEVLEPCRVICVGPPSLFPTLALESAFAGTVLEEEVAHAGNIVVPSESDYLAEGRYVIIHDQIRIGARA